MRTNVGGQSACLEFRKTVLQKQGMNNVSMYTGRVLFKAAPRWGNAVGSVILFKSSAHAPPPPTSTQFQNETLKSQGYL